MHTLPLASRFSPLIALARAVRERLHAGRLRSGRRTLAVVALAGALAGVAALSLLAQNGGPPQTAFARAPSGQYAVLAKNTGEATVVTVLGTATNAAAMEIATVAHLPGTSLRGAVSPSGRHVALITPDTIVLGRPVASLLTLDLETGQIRRLAEGLEPLQNALWTPDSTAVVVTYRSWTATGDPLTSVVRIEMDGTGTVLETHEGATIVAPVGFDTLGQLLAVRIDERGSTLTRDGVAVRWLSTHITRDWALSPDGTRLAFVEANTWQGLRYLPRVVWIEGGGGVSAASASGQQALGAAWAPSGHSPQFGNEPHTPSGSVSAQSGTGFDVPLAYSRDGSSLAVQHWSGSSFADPGTPQLQVVSITGRQPLSGFSRFFGWSAR